jgi:inorganic pyrophosphatase
MEVSLSEKDNPIRQDLRKVKVTPGQQQEAQQELRYYAERIRWNYGMLPQTWEDPTHNWDRPGMRGFPGDGDPVDVIEIGSQKCLTGHVYAVKVLGAFALIDDGEVDWKIIAIRMDDELAPLIHDVADLEHVLPGELDRIRTWLRDYKIPDGKPANQFGLGGKCLSATDAQRMVIAQAHHDYQAHLKVH